MNISILRTILDKLGGLRVTQTSVTPRRSYRLPETLSPENARRVLAAGNTLRDQLLLGLLYGCGLKVSEACGLRWRDVDGDTGRLFPSAVCLSPEANAFPPFFSLFPMPASGYSESGRC